MRTTVDGLLDNRLELEQPQMGFRTAIDAVLLAAAVDASPHAAVLDAGAGTGAAALCLAQRRPDLKVTGLEIEPATAALAGGNVARNKLDGNVTIVAGDLFAPPSDVASATFASVMTNPPFHAPQFNASYGGLTDGHGVMETADRRLAKVDRYGPEAWLRACLKRLASRGRLVLIHRADRLPAVLAALDPHAGDIEILPLYGRADGRPAKRVIVRCRKGAGGPTRLCPGLVLHDAAGMFTKAAEAMLRHGLSLDEVLAMR